MSKPFEEMSTLDRLVHEPARLAILTALAACRGCDFVYLQSLTAITKGNLSDHLLKLQEGGLVDIEKGFQLPVRRGSGRSEHVPDDGRHEILHRLKGKSAKRYPPGTVLIVNCDSDGLFLEDERDKAVQRVKAAQQHLAFQETLLVEPGRGYPARAVAPT